MFEIEFQTDWIVNKIVSYNKIVCNDDDRCNDSAGGISQNPNLVWTFFLYGTVKLSDS